jgi:hypothetical protein
VFTCQLVALAPSVALAVIKRYEQACLEEASRTSIAGAGEAPAEHSSGLAQRLVCEDERLAMGARLEWIEYARRELKAIASGRSAAR